MTLLRRIDKLEAHVRSVLNVREGPIFTEEQVFQIDRSFLRTYDTAPDVSDTDRELFIETLEFFKMTEQEWREYIAEDMKKFDPDNTYDLDWSPLTGYAKQPVDTDN